MHNFKKECEEAEKILNTLNGDDGKPKPFYLTREGFEEITRCRRILNEKKISELGLKARRILRRDISYYKKDTLTPEDFEKITTDQGKENGKQMGFKDLPQKSPDEIRGIDGVLCMRVRGYLLRDPSYQKYEIRKMILGNPHLHDVVKANLLDNLKHR